MKTHLDWKVEDPETVRALIGTLKRIDLEIAEIDKQASFTLPPRITKEELVKEKMQRFEAIKRAVRTAGLRLGDAIDELRHLEDMHGQKAEEGMR